MLRYDEDDYINQENSANALDNIIEKQGNFISPYGITVLCEEDMDSCLREDDMSIEVDEDAEFKEELEIEHTKDLCQLFR